MRIAQVTDCYLPRLGGIELHVRDLAAHQAAAGHDVEIFTSTPAAADGAGGAPDRDACVRRYATLTGDLPAGAGLAALQAAIAHGGYDVVHTHTSTFSPFAWSGLRSAVRAGVPAVTTLHSMLAPQARLLRLSAAATGWSRWPVAWTAVSAAAAAPLRAVVGREAVTVLPNGIEAAAWHVASPRRPDRPLTVASVMRLSRRKRPGPLLGILAGIRAAIPAEVPLRAVIVGEGPRRPELERAVRSAGMDPWVTLTGALGRSQVRDVLSLADVYLAPARRESFGIAALEARCTGLPVVAMAAGGVREFVRDGVEGYLVDSDAAMAEVTARLLTSPQLRRMQEHNRTTAPELEWESLVSGCLELYGRAAVIAGGRPARTRVPAAR
jgi:glycosyltransferase involved in cell wall biosynthesis